MVARQQVFLICQIFRYFKTAFISDVCQLAILSNAGICPLNWMDLHFCKIHVLIIPLLPHLYVPLFAPFNKPVTLLMHNFSRTRITLRWMRIRCWRSILRTIWPALTSSRPTLSASRSSPVMFAPECPGKPRRETTSSSKYPLWRPGVYDLTSSKLPVSLCVKLGQSDLLDI